MPLYSVFIRYSIEPDNSKIVCSEVTTNVIRADSEKEAIEKAIKIGKSKNTAYKNLKGNTVKNIFSCIVEVQFLNIEEFSDGMEVCSWIYEGDQLVLNDGWQK